MTIKIAVAGAMGRMGQGIIMTSHNQGDLEIVAAIEADESKKIGIDIGKLVGIGKINVPLTKSSLMAETLEKCQAQVLIDFTSAEASVANVKTASKIGINLVVGTTGFSPEQKKEIEDAITGNKIDAVVSPNMATGVNIFFKIAGELASKVGDDFDIEIIEAHHRYKKDAPSGTAMRVGELVAGATGRELEKDGVFGRQKGVIGARKTNEIGFSSIRAGDIVGDHTVLYAGEGERIELVHRLHSRQALINGAIRAARFIAEKEGHGRIYNTWDVLGL